MKTGAIIRIIVFGLIALALIGVLVYFLEGGELQNVNFKRNDGRSDGASSFGGERAAAPSSDKSGAAADEPAASQQPEAAQIDASGVTKLEIDWISGGVTIEPTDGELSFREDYTGEEKYQMYWKISGDTLRIDDFAPNVTANLFNLNLPSKQLTVYLPRSVMEKVKIVTTSASVELQGFETRKLDVETVSGRVSGVVTRADEADIETVSGQIELTLGQCGKLDVSSTSGSVQAVCYAGLQEADLESVSGKLDLTIPMGSGYRLDWDTVSGSLDDQTASAGGFGSGEKVEIDAETISGGLTIRNATEQELP